MSARRGRARARGGPAALGAVVLIACASVPGQPAAAAGRPAASPPDRVPVGQAPISGRDAAGAGPIRDTVLSGARARAAALRIPPGDVYRAGGVAIRVAFSRSYAPDSAIGRSWAGFIASLLHGSEADRLTVYLAPQAEMESICGNEAAACYSPPDDTMVVTGRDSPGGAALEQTAAHEYGHHIAHHRDNRPWIASLYGPKYWASYHNVCSLTRRGILHPGDEGTGYAQNPGEGWAEAYRYANGYRSSWGIVDPFFKPDATALRLIREDVLDPWRGPASRLYRGGYGRRGSRWKEIAFSTFVEGTAQIEIRSTGTLDADLFLWDPGARRFVASARRPGHGDVLRFTICGQPRMAIDTYRYSGYGTWRMRITKP